VIHIFRKGHITYKKGGGILSPANREAESVVEDITFNSITTPEDQQGMAATNKINDFVGGVMDNITEALTGESLEDK
jgi:hypothetical protein